jgi:hypothetical protein
MFVPVRHGNSSSHNTLGVSWAGQTAGQAQDDASLHGDADQKNHDVLHALTHQVTHQQQHARPFLW